MDVCRSLFLLFYRGLRLGIFGDVGIFFMILLYFVYGIVNIFILYYNLKCIRYIL